MLLLAEQEFEHQAVQKAVAEWKAKNPGKSPKEQEKSQKQEAAVPAPTTEAAGKVEARPDTRAAGEPEATRFNFKAYVDVPTMQEIERLIVEKKKQALLNKYTSAELQQQNAESSELVVGNDAATPA